MTNSLLFGEFVYDRLKSDTRLTELVGEKIYPILIKDEDIKYPFIVFFRNTLHSVMNKFNVFEDTLNYSVVVVTNKYIDGVEIANEVRRVMEFKKAQTDNMTVYDSLLTSCDEGYLADAYVQTLTFDCKIH